MVCLVRISDACLVIALAALTGHWVMERRRLRRFVRSLGPLPADSRVAALEVAGRIFARPRRDDDPPYLAPLLAPLGATAGDVIAFGGCCSGTSRLVILCLTELGIRAHQITVYHRRGFAQHCLVEVVLPDGPLIIDAFYGLHYSDEAGHPIGLEQLQSGATPQFAPLPHSNRSAYPPCGYYDFDFTLTKTANWTKSPHRRLAYRILTGITSGAVNRLRMPATLEWPQVLLAMLVIIAAAATHVLAGIVRWAAF